MQHPHDQTMSSTEATGRTIGRILGLFSIVGACLGAGVILGLWGIGFFDSDADFGALFMGAMVLMIGFVFAAFIGIVVAAVAGHYASLAHKQKNASMRSAFIGSGLGHILLFVAFTVVVTVAIVVAEADTMEGGEEDPFGGGQEPAGEGAGDDSPAEGVPEYRTLVLLALAAVPAAIVGLVTAQLFWRRTHLQEDAQQTVGQAQESWPPREFYAQEMPPQAPQAPQPPQQEHPPPPPESQPPPPGPIVRRKCPRCSTIVEVQEGDTPVCPNCGFGSG